MKSYKKQFLLTRNLKLIICISVLAFTISCTKKCPDLDEEILEWIPYENNDTIFLINKAADSTVMLTINNVIVDHTTQYKTNQDCGTCDDYIHIDGNGISVTMYLNENKIDSERYSVMGMGFGDYKEFKDFSFEGKIYKLVRVFENNYSQKLIIAKDIGIIGVIDGENGIWVINDGKVEGTKRKPIKINEVHC